MNFVSPDDPILREVMPRFEGDPRSLFETARWMWNRMLHGNGVEKRGMGLAAPQLGLRLRMFVMVNSHATGSGFGFGHHCINPQVVERSEDFIEGEEGCLTLPGFRAKVLRPHRITARWTTLKGRERTVELFGLSARCFLHETDHLNGVTIFQPVVALAPPAET